MNPPYRETFDKGPGGWFGWQDNRFGPKPLEWTPGQVTSRSPWWVDYNHAPPGAGYLHMLFCLQPRGPTSEYYAEVAGPNRFIDGGISRNLTDARLGVRLHGELLTRGASLVLLVQSTIDDFTSAWVLTSQPFTVTPQWSEQQIVCCADETQWTCLGGRHDRSDYYGHLPLAHVLNDVNASLMLVLFPLTIDPMGPIAGDPHTLRADKDYPLWRSRLPEGYVTLDTIWIDPATRSNAQ